MPERILVLQLKRIGDAVLTAPAIALLRDSFPSSRLTLVLSSAAAHLGDGFCGIDEILCYRPGRTNLKVWYRIASGNFDTCLDFSGNDRSALMTRLSAARCRLGYKKFTMSQPLRRAAFTELCDASVRDLHTVDFHFALAQMVDGIASIAPKSGFAIPDCLHRTAESLRSELGERYAIVHPGTARREKYWPAERWANVVDHLQNVRGIPCVLTGSLDDPEESAHLNKIEQSTSDAPHNLAGRLSLLEVAAALGGCTIALGVDSAAMHLAAMLGRPQIVLFGPTNPFHWRPRHKNASVLLAGDESLNVNTFQPKHCAAPMTDLSTDQVCRAIDARLAAV